LGAADLRRVRRLRERFDFVHLVQTDAGVVYFFAYDPRKPVQSTLSELVPGGRWRVVTGPGEAQITWDLRGHHLLHGEEPRPGARLALDRSAHLLDARRLLAGDASSILALDKGVELVEFWAGRGRVSVAVSRLGRRAVRLEYAHGHDFGRAGDCRDVERLVDRERVLARFSARLSAGIIACGKTSEPRGCKALLPLFGAVASRRASF